MAKYSNVHRLSKTTRARLLTKLAVAITSMRTLDEAVALIQDLFTSSEATMLAKRLAIADELLEHQTYAQIRALHAVSNGTIARVAEWLRSSGRGYQVAHQRAELRGVSSSRSTGKPTMYNWPIKALEALFDAADARERKQLNELVGTLDRKSNLYRELQPFLVGEYQTTRKTTEKIPQDSNES